MQKGASAVRTAVLARASLPASQVRLPPAPATFARASPPCDERDAPSLWGFPPCPGLARDGFSPGSRPSRADAALDASGRARPAPNRHPRGSRAVASRASALVCAPDFSAIPSVARSHPSLTPLSSPPPVLQLAVPAMALPAAWRAYGAGYLDKAQVTDRVVTVVKNFNKVDPAKVTPTASFGADLGLDSLDTVEVVMAMEEEFAVEIPDAEADKITSVAEAVEYLSSNPDAK